jgi:hypothetical protein
MHSHPREKTGRNDLCPCGSGKKHMQCCLSNISIAFASPKTLNTPWSRQRDASDRLTADLMRVLKRDFADAALDAWADFNQDDDPVSLNEMPHEISIFSPYVLFEWDPEKPLPRSAQKPQGGVVIQAFLKESASRLSVLEHLILEQAIARPVSFYEIVRVRPGRGVVLRDLLIGEETEIEEHSGSEMMRSGDVLYAQLWILPLQAVADPVGREMVEALLQGWERQNEVPGGAGIVRPDINALRRLLNLPVKTESPLK